VSVIKNPKKWYVRLFTLGKNFSYQTFSDNSKKFLLNAIGLFIVVTFTFYVENRGQEYETKQNYIESVKNIENGLVNVISYSNEYKGIIEWVADMYKEQFDKWEVDSDSIFVDQYEEEDGSIQLYAPMADFNQSMPFAPPKIGFEIWSSGDQQFKLVDPKLTSVISKIYDGYELEFLLKNTSEIEEAYITEYNDILKRWSKDIDVTKKDEYQFWIENRRYIQNDNQLKYLLFRRLELWEYSIEQQINDYIEILETRQKILDSVVNVYNNEKYFIYWKIN
jgi:hypothetical protein